jgi:hypothetical protein
MLEQATPVIYNNQCKEENAEEENDRWIIFCYYPVQKVQRIVYYLKRYNQGDKVQPESWEVAMFTKILVLN